MREPETLPEIIESGPRNKSVAYFYTIFIFQEFFYILCSLILRNFLVRTLQ